MMDLFSRICGFQVRTAMAWAWAWALEHVVGLKRKSVSFLHHAWHWSDAETMSWQACVFCLCYDVVLHMNAICLITNQCFMLPFRVESCKQITTEKTLLWTQSIFLLISFQHMKWKNKRMWSKDKIAMMHRAVCDEGTQTAWDSFCECPWMMSCVTCATFVEKPPVNLSSKTPSCDTSRSLKAK